MGEKLDKIIEGYKPIPMKRMMYPRGMKLSEDFVNAFHREFDRLVDEGANPKSLVERFGKALRFHQTEERRYHQIDEKNNKKKQTDEEIRAEVEDLPVDPHEGVRPGDPNRKKLQNRKEPGARGTKGEAFNQGQHGNFVEVATKNGIVLMTPEEAEEYRKKQANNIEESDEHDNTAHAGQRRRRYKHKPNRGGKGGGEGYRSGPSTNPKTGKQSKNAAIGFPELDSGNFQGYVDDDD